MKLKLFLYIACLWPVLASANPALSPLPIGPAAVADQNLPDASGGPSERVEGSSGRQNTIRNTLVPLFVALGLALPNPALAVQTQELPSRGAPANETLVAGGWRGHSGRGHGHGGGWRRGGNYYRHGGSWGWRRRSVIIVPALCSYWNCAPRPYYYRNGGW